MKNDIHFTSRMLFGAAGMMTVSGALMALTGRWTISLCMLASAACLGLSAYVLKNKIENQEETNHDQETL